MSLWYTSFVKIKDARYILRPEAIEPVFILYRITSDETLKYFYLTFSELDLVSLNEYGLNTEAHPCSDQAELPSRYLSLDLVGILVWAYMDITGDT
ncbi:glycoside hydrolase [Calycina marina]|uniref:Glycoside hydrolase n=1 Tax=Calycina marina TaxID=1763456 RepID=A0A9P8CB18_9HELO|nr:glycoside hydrolase [Calycina marina]